MKTAARNHEKAAAKVAHTEAEVEAVKNRLSEVDTKLKDLEEEARTCMTEFQQIQASVSDSVIENFHLCFRMMRTVVLIRCLSIFCSVYLV